MGWRHKHTFTGSPFLVIGDDVYSTAAVGGLVREIRRATVERPTTPSGLSVVPAPATDSAAHDGPAVTRQLLAWSDHSSAEAGFIVQRSLHASFDVIDTTLFTAGDVTSVVDETALAGVTYFYRVAAVNAGGESSLSNRAGSGAVRVLEATLDDSRAAHAFVIQFSATWNEGDLDYDGVVNLNDLIRLANNYGSSFPMPVWNPPLPDTGESSPAKVAAADVPATPQAIPVPPEIPQSKQQPENAAPFKPVTHPPAAIPSAFGTHRVERKANFSAHARTGTKPKGTRLSFVAPTTASTVKSSAFARPRVTVLRRPQAGLTESDISIVPPRLPMSEKAVLRALPGPSVQRGDPVTP